MLTHISEQEGNPFACRQEFSHVKRLEGCAMRDPDGECYRARAEECRIIAEEYLDADARSVMLRVAADYERMAETADQLDSDIAELAALASVASRDRKAN